MEISFYKYSLNFKGKLFDCVSKDTGTLFVIMDDSGEVIVYFGS